MPQDLIGKNVFRNLFLSGISMQYSSAVQNHNHEKAEEIHQDILNSLEYKSLQEDINND